jgi:hypothetical protein
MSQKQADIIEAALLTFILAFSVGGTWFVLERFG